MMGKSLSLENLWDQAYDLASKDRRRAKLRGMINRSPVGMVGFGVMELWDDQGDLKDGRAFGNLITTVGDQYYSQQAIAGVLPAGAAAPTLARSLKLGTGSTAAAKSGAGAALVTYTSGSKINFDASYPQSALIATDSGYNAVYKGTYAAGVATGTAYREITMSTGNTDAAGTAADTLARSVYASLDKGASDSLVVTWNHKFFGQ